uniref:Uncharacterized protein n=1 Tax=viral metagenome TaxID=1070528 RepID=A0A6C0B0J9_9ZZZZ
MSWATCYSGSNNIHFDFPPIMADGRNYASWQPEAVVNDRIRQQENIKTSWQYRQYLINNASTIMKINNQEACTELGLPSHFSTNATPSSNVPFTFRTTYDTEKPGFGYNTSNLKQPYLTREQLQARMVAPIINTNQ